MNWKDYENITRYIYEHLGKKTGVKIIGYGDSFKVKGKSGVSHQIDVLTSHSDGIHRYKTAIECKYWEKKVNKDIVMKVAEIVEDANFHKGVIVSKSGFTEDGVLFAKRKNIGLIELRETNNDKENDKETVFSLGQLIIDIKINRKRPKILNLEFDFEKKESDFEDLDRSDIQIISENGREVDINIYTDDFKEELHKYQSVDVFEKYYKLENVSILNIPTNTKRRIKGLKLSGILEVKNMDEKRQFNIVDEVCLTMKSLFENNSYTISKLGMIRKN